MATTMTYHVSVIVLRTFVYLIVGVMTLVLGVLSYLSESPLLWVRLNPIFKNFPPGVWFVFASNFPVQESGNNGWGEIVIWGVHEHQIPARHGAIARNRFQQDLDQSFSQPLHVLLMYGGDLNRVRPCETRNYIDPIDQAHNLINPSVHADNLSFEINAWTALLDRLIEIETSPHSHYCKKGGF